MDAHGSQRVSLERARSVVVAQARVAAGETIATESAAGRVLAEPVFARLASPHYRASAMDGIAVRAADTAGASPAAPVLLELGTDDGAGFVDAHAGADAHAGERRAGAAKSRHGGPAERRLVCRQVDTGSALPDWADAVVRIEDTRRTDAGFEVRNPVYPNRDVRRVGEDIDAGALIAGRGRTIGAHEIGALLATGVAHVSVRRRPRIAVMATGSEVIEPLAPDDSAAPGKVIEYNSRVLAAYARDWGADVDYLGRAADDEADLAGRIRAAVASHDALCIIAGSSAGRKDFSVAALARCGDVLFHGVDVMPGRPAAFAVVRAEQSENAAEGRRAGVFVIPGYPVSAALIYRELVRAWVDASLGRTPGAPATVRAVVRRKIASRLGVEELVRVCLVFDGDQLVVAPLPRGAGSISSLLRAHGLLRIGPGVEGFDAGASVDVELLEPFTDTRACIVVGGPPDHLTSGAEDVLARTGTPLRFSHLGLAPHDAIAALAAGEAHLAVLDAAHAGAGAEIPVHARALALGDARVVVSRALLDAPAGTRVVAALSTAAGAPAA
jgi:putative molybdopterin biosynthesis protein